MGTCPQNQAVLTSTALMILRKNYGGIIGLCSFSHIGYCPSTRPGIYCMILLYILVIQAIAGFVSSLKNRYTDCGRVYSVLLYVDNVKSRY